ncbi:hypothetical protein HC766_01930 [Candidatus Gracilibacteria bacterium]|nr:hypothetical protein [Candidatus Gracilibacteria bacterium]
MTTFLFLLGARLIEGLIVQVLIGQLLAGNLAGNFFSTTSVAEVSAAPKKSN